MHTLQKNRKLNFLLHIAQLFLYTFTVDILLSELVFLFGHAISWYTLPLSFLIALLCLLYFYGDEPGRQTIYEVAVTILLFIFLTGLCGKMLDFSYDGNSYHKIAIGLLRNHWNPIWQPQEQVAAEVMRFPVKDIWVECYAKGVWIFAAGVYGITGNIECGKVYTLIGITCAFLLTYYCMRSCKKGKVFALLFSAAAALNPITLRQTRVFYVDGYLHIMLYILVLSLAMMANRVKDKTEKLIFSSIIACAMIICATTKFTGLLYGGVYCIAYFLYYCYCQLNGSDPKRWTNIRKCFCLFALLAAVTVIWAGADTYVVNTIRHGSPVYPLYGGEGTIDIITINSSFTEVNRVKNLLISLFSKVSNPMVVHGTTHQLKIPFTIDWTIEGKWTSIFDSHASGFGVFFSGLLLIALASIIIKIRKTVIQQKSGERGVILPFWLVILVVSLGLCFAITESWWARYAPYIYFVVLMGFYFIGDTLLETEGKGPKKYIGILLFILFLSNSLIFLNGITTDLQKSAEIRAEFKNLKQYAAVETDVKLLGVYFNLKDQSIYYMRNDDLKNSGTGVLLPYMELQVLPK